MWTLIHVARTRLSLKVCYRWTRGGKNTASNIFIKRHHLLKIDYTIK
nr:MAG TPA: hypothetical protein [Caudoviricetes sp.]DAQ41884.1 MAG TPA: hypothetical protein [Caudoviricetes sp.]